VKVKEHERCSGQG